MPTRASSTSLVFALGLLGACATGPTRDPASPDPTPIAMPDPYPRYDARTFFETEHAYGASFSHDGARVLIGSDRTGVMEVYVAPATGGELVQATPSTGESQSPLAFFPNDDRFVLITDSGGNEILRLIVVDEDGSRHDLIPSPEARGEFAGWTRDGEYFFVFSNERDPKAMDLYRYVSADLSRELIWQNDDLRQLGVVSDDGRWATLNQIHDNRDTDILLLDLSKKKAKPKLVTTSKHAADTLPLTFTPDLTKLIYRTDEHGEFRQVWSYDLASAKHELVLAADWDVFDFSYSREGRYRGTLINEDASFVLRIYDDRSGEELALEGLPQGEIRGMVFSKDERKLLVAIGSERRSFDLFVVELEAGGVTRLTDTLNPAIDPEQLVDSQVIRYPSFDGVEIPALLYKPREASPEHPVPALLYIHGGPGGQSLRSYDPDIQYLVNHGVAVLAVNNRGSSGYGKTFFHLDDRRHGEDDLDDCVEAKKWLQSLDWIDADRIGITGGSYGGYMVLAALAFRPEEFALGIDYFGVANWVRTLESIPPWWASERNYLVAELGDPEDKDDRAQLDAKSPLLHPEGIVRPLLVIQGANDPRVLAVESEEIVAAVKAKGAPVEYVVFDDEGHGFHKRHNRVAAAEATLRFVDTHLRE
jgi:dipeptidyl aminopeptidase/acylaminoacyl peptidase